jgi:hypothetical protein
LTSVGRATVQILSFEDGKVARTVVYGDLDEGRAASGLLMSCLGTFRTRLMGGRSPMAEWRLRSL